MAGDLTFNKYAAAILATALGFMIVKEISHGAIHVEKQDKLAYCAECVPKEKGPATVELAFPQQDWIDAMDAAKGEKYFAACSTCHTVNAGGDNKQGPNLWNIVGRPAGSIEYSYSPGMSGMGINWGYEELDTFLKRPAKYVKGTKMGYGGEKKPHKRAALIAYLRTLSDNPMTLPVAAAGPEAAENVEDMSAPVEGGSTTVIETVKDKAGDVMEKTADAASDVARDIKDGTEDAMNKVADGAESAAGKAVEIASDVKDGAQDIADKVSDGVAAVAEDVKDTVLPQIDEGNDMVEDELKKAKELVTEGDE